MIRFATLCTVLMMTLGLGCGGSDKQHYIPTGETVKPFQAPERADLLPEAEEDDEDADDEDGDGEDDEAEDPAPAAKPASTATPK